MPTISNEDYLKAVYGFNKESGLAVSTSKVADKLEVSNAATSEMARKLADKGLLEYSKYKGVELTEPGEKIALKIIRRHRLWELFLIKVLGLTWAQVHDEAERLEHHTSDFLIDKLDDFLGNPEFDPHGDPIPRADGTLPELPPVIPLNEVETGKEYKIIKVNDLSNDLMNYFTKLGIKLQIKISVLDRFPFDNSVIIQIDGTRNSISEKVAENIFVIPLKKGE